MIKVRRWLILFKKYVDTEKRYVCIPRSVRQSENKNKRNNIYYF